MTEPGWADAVLVTALLAPLVGLVGLLGRPGAGSLGRVVVGRTAQGGALVAASCWFALLAAGAAPAVGRFAPDELTLAACLGATLIGAGAAPVAGVAVAGVVGALTAAMALTTDGRPSTTGLALGLVAAWGIAVSTRTITRWPAILSGAGVALAVFALLDIGDAGTAELRPLTLLGAGSATLALVAGSRPRQPVSILLVGVLLASLRLLPGLPEGGAAHTLAVSLALAGTIASAFTLPERWRGGVPLRAPSPVAGIAVWSLAVVASPLEAATFVAVLLAAAAVILAAVPAPAVLVAAVPGAVLLAVGLTDADGGVLGPLAVLAATTVVVLAAGVSGADPSDATPGRDQAALDAVPALLLGAWLVAIPGSWAFAGPPDVSSYERAAALAIAAGLVSAVLFGAAVRRAPTLGWLASLPAQPVPPERPQRPERVSRRGARAQRRARDGGGGEGLATAPAPTPAKGAERAVGDRRRRRPLRASKP